MPKTKSDGRAGRKFEELVRILQVLRGPGGCPWDGAQDARSIRDYFLEEVYEAVEALDIGDAEGLAEELGDVLMEVVFLARIFEEQGMFAVSDSLDRINAKMIARHPHVFGRKRTLTAGGVAEAWHQRKKAEKPGGSVLGEPRPSTPALLQAFLIGRRVSGFGFDWPSAQGALEKVSEESAELSRAIRGRNRRRIEEELGDLLFALTNAGRKLGINPETALRRANRKFVARFRALEASLAVGGKKMGEASLEEMDAIWEKNKKRRPRRAKPGR